MLVANNSSPCSGGCHVIVLLLLVLPNLSRQYNGIYELFVPEAMDTWIGSLPAVIYMMHRDSRKMKNHCNHFGHVRPSQNPENCMLRLGYRIKEFLNKTMMCLGNIPNQQQNSWLDYCLQI